MGLQRGLGLLGGQINKFNTEIRINQRKVG